MSSSDIVDKKAGDSSATGLLSPLDASLFDIPLNIEEDCQEIKIETSKNATEKENGVLTSNNGQINASQATNDSVVFVEEAIKNKVVDEVNLDETIDELDRSNAEIGNGTEQQQPPKELQTVLPESVKQFKKADDGFVMLVDKLPETCTKLSLPTQRNTQKDSVMFRKLIIRGLHFCDLFNPTMYTLIQLSGHMDFECKNIEKPSKGADPMNSQKCGRLILTFSNILDRFTYMRRYLLDFEIPERHIEIVCQLPKDKTVDLLEMWKASKQEEKPPCLSADPERQMLARQLIVKGLPESIGEADVIFAFKIAENVNFVLDYENVRCAVLTFPDMLSCNVAHARRNEVKFEGKRFDCFLMTEMASKSKLMPLKEKEQGEEDVQTKNTFNALWQSMISTVEEIRNKPTTYKGHHSEKQQQAKPKSSFPQKAKPNTPLRTPNNANAANFANKPAQTAANSNVDAKTTPPNQQKTNIAKSQQQKQPQRFNQQQKFGNKAAQSNFGQKRPAGGPNSRDEPPFKMSKSQRKWLSRRMGQPDNNPSSNGRFSNEQHMSARYSEPLGAGGFGYGASPFKTLAADSPWASGAYSSNFGGSGSGGARNPSGPSFPSGMFGADSGTDFGGRGGGSMGYGSSGSAFGSGFSPPSTNMFQNTSGGGGFGSERFNDGPALNINQPYGRQLPSGNTISNNGRYFNNFSNN